MRLLAPAKINLHLRVGAVRSDGFHPLLTWMTTVALFDTIEIEPAPLGQESEGISLSCDDAKIPCDATNLVIRAAKLMSPANREPSGSAAGPTGQNAGSRGLKIHLSKHIPACGGLGGGSSDAARILLGLNRFWQMNLPVDQLAQLAQQLGSDVPFFLYGPSSICQGRGEIVQPISRPKPRWATLVLPDITMPTPRVYRVFDALGPGKDETQSDQPIGQEWAFYTADALLPRLVNDLEAPAFEISPELGRLRSDLEQSLGRIVRMSGSGSTLFTLFDERREAEDASESLSRQGLRSVAVEIGIEPEDDLSNY